MVGLLALPGYHTIYNDRIYLPSDVPANVGYAASDRHFSRCQDESRPGDGRRPITICAIPRTSW